MRTWGWLAGSVLLTACKLLDGDDDGSGDGDAAVPRPDASMPTAVDRLRAASSVPVDARTASDGRILEIEGSFETSGATPEERAMGFLDAHGEAFGLTRADSDLDVVGARTDALGTVVYTEGRVNLRIPVLAGEVRVHLDAAGRVVFVANELPPDFRVRDYEPSVRSVTARANAEMFTGLPADPSREPRVVVFNGGMLLGTEGRSTLGILVRVGTGVAAREVVIDGNAGDLLMSWAAAPSAEERQTWVGAPERSPVLAVFQQSGETRVLCPPEVECPGPADMPVPAYCGAGRCPAPPGSPAPRITQGNLEDALELHAHVGTACTFLARTFGRNGITDAGGVITQAYLSAGSNNAFAIGGGESGDPGIVVDPVFLQLDVVAHEIGHELYRAATAGPDRNNARIGNAYPGAVGEAMADLFASFVDVAAPGTLGEGLGALVPGNPCPSLRNLDDPHACGHPAHFREYRRPTPAGPCRDASPQCDEGYGCTDGVSCYRDDGEVHANSTILSHAFRLLVTGGRHGVSGIEVRRIGTDARGAEAKVRQIWYRAINRYLGPASGFYGVRSYARRACRELAAAAMFGIEIRDCGALLNAFAAVGLGEEDWDEDSWDNLIDDCPRMYDPEQDCSPPEDAGRPLPEAGPPPPTDASVPDVSFPDASEPTAIHSCAALDGTFCTNLTGLGYRIDRVAASEGCNPDTMRYVESPCPEAGSVGACTEWIGMISEMQIVYYAPAFDPAEEAAECAALAPPIGPGRWESPYNAPR